MKRIACLIVVLMAAMPCLANNDDCDDAEQIGNVTNQPFDTSGATFDGSGWCMTSPNIWYCYTASSTGGVTVSLCGSFFDTKLAIYYAGSDCNCNSSSIDLLECNDDSCGLQSEATFSVSAGTKYLIEVGGWANLVGQGVLNISVAWLENDDCDDAEQIGNVTNQPFDTSAATFDGPGHCMTSPNTWYRYTATCTGSVTVSLCGSSYDTKLAVYNGPDCNPSLSDLIECNDDSCGWQSEITFDATAGEQYLIEVGGYGSDTGSGVISISCEEDIPPVASFTYSPENPVVGEEITFEAESSSDPDGEIVRYQWRFGDGSSGSNREGTHTHTYSEPGEYTVRLTVTDDDGLEDSKQRNVIVIVGEIDPNALTFIIYVDDDSPNDPAPYDASVSDPNENGTPEHPFDMIQEGIDAALDGETVIVRYGTYRGAIEFAGRNITVTGFDPNDPNAMLPYPVIDANYTGTAVTFCNEEELNCMLEGFVITRGAGEVAGGINCMGSSPTISHCLILDNHVIDPNGGGGAVSCVDSNAVFANCTFSGNYGGQHGAGLYLCDSNAVLLNCIVWDNLPYQIAVACGLDPNITFSDVQDTWPGQGNIDIAPFFAELGYWADANNPNIAIEPSEANAVWVGGDYHLKSQAGRWEPYSASWLIDDVTSLCIDAGDPNSDWTAELWPHGIRINMGAYGGTPQASMSLSTVADPLSEALDTSLSFTTGGDADFFAQTATAYYDGYAAQSGDISGEQESWMQTTVSGAGTVSFYWKVSSEGYCDYLKFYIDGSLQDRISGAVGWQQMTYTITASGPHTLEWRYTKDQYASKGDDCGWVDKVEWGS